MGGGGPKKKEFRPPSRHALNLWVSYVTPAIMAGLVVYATWVFVLLVCVNYLLLDRKRKATAAALLATYLALLLLMASAYVRVLWVVNTSPGFIPRYPENEKTVDSVESHDDPEIGLGGGQEDEWQVESVAAQRLQPVVSAEGPQDNVSESLVDDLGIGPMEGDPKLKGSPKPQTQTITAEPPALSPLQARGPEQLPHMDTWPDPPLGGEGSLPNTPHGRPYGIYGPPRPLEGTGDRNLEEWYKRDVFVCESDGLPRWCPHCKIWKPDRSHHCGEVQRCVWKMDHFCPWVGGVVSEPSYKFFYHVLVYGTLYCIFLVASLAALLSSQLANHEYQDPRWIACLALASIFGLFVGVMAATTTQLIYRNISTIENLNHKTKVYQLAVHDPNPPQQPFLDRQDLSIAPSIPRIWLPKNPAPGQTQRCFAIVRTRQGDNPWRLRSGLDNFKEVLGYSYWDWWLPIKRSPLTKKNRADGWYQWNEELLVRLRKEAGIGEPSS